MHDFNTNSTLLRSDFQKNNFEPHLFNLNQF
jgi:hypothetical protein